MRSRFAHSAIARSLFRIHCVGRGYAPFSSAHSFRGPIRGRRPRMSAWRLASRPPTRPATRVLVSPLCSLFIVHPCRSKQDGGVVSRLPACLVPRLVKSFAPLPVASLTAFVFAYSVSSLVPSCVSPLVSFSCRPASSSRSHFIPSCPMCRTAFRPSCGRAVLFSSSHRSPHALPSSSPHDRITRAGQRIPPTPSERASNKPTEPYGTRRTPIVMIRIARRPRRNALSHIHNTTETKDE